MKVTLSFECEGVDKSSLLTLINDFDGFVQAVYTGSEKTTFKTEVILD